MSTWARIVIVVALAGAVLTGVLLFPVDRWALALVAWIRSAGPAGALLFAVAYVVATVLLLPGSVLALGAGFAYGPALGLLLVSPVSVLAATAAFSVGRSIARGWVSRKVSGDPRFTAIDEAVGESGFKIVFLLRLSPVLPFNLLNYALGLTRVSLRHYVVASFLGMLPGTLLYVYLGSLVTSASEIAAGHRASAGGWQKALYLVGLVATVAATVIITRISRQALARALDRKRAAPAARLPGALEIDVDDRGTLCVFAKPPRPGEVKTRLAEEIGAESAAALARAFFLDTWRVATSCPWSGAVLATTDAEAPEWAGIAPIWPQGGGDLGDRLERVLQRALRSAPFALAIGTDSPGLPQRLLEAVPGALASAEAVIGPCEDGGFYLIGLRRCPPGLLADLPWSAEDTFAKTFARLCEHNLTVEVLPPWFDVDTVADLSRMRTLLSRGDLEAPETERALRTIAVKDGSGGCA